MAIDVVSDQYHGKVVLIDRKPDGSELLLVCEEWRPGSPPIGPVVVPEPSPQPPPERRGKLPLGLTTTGTLSLDITALPSALIAFDSERFCRASIALLREGIEERSIGPEEAEEFGYRATLGDEAPAGAAG